MTKPQTSKTDLPYILIARASTDGQDASINTQIDLALQWSAVSGYRLIIDERYHALESGSKLNRDSVANALKVIQKGQAAGILVTALDRLGRSTFEVCRIMNELESIGGFLKIVSQPIDTSTPEGKAFVQMLAVVAELERKFICRRIQQAKALRRKEGRCSGKIPYGFTCEEGSDVLIPHPYEAMVCKIIIKLNKSMGVVRMRKELTRLGYLARNGNPFHETQLARILRRYKKDATLRKILDDFTPVVRAEDYGQQVSDGENEIQRFASEDSANGSDREYSIYLHGDERGEDSTLFTL